MSLKVQKNKKTKIVATIGPSTSEEKIIKKLILAGVNVFRFNMKHGTLDWHEENIKKVQKVADELDIHIGILIDLQGPEIRIETRDQQAIPLKRNQQIVFNHEFEKPEDQVKIKHKSVFEALKVGDKFSIDDGFLRFTVVEKHGLRIVAKSFDEGQIEHRKGLNLFKVDVDLPSLIDDDIKKLALASKEKVDFVALSFVRTRKDVETLKKEMDKKKINAQIVAKIESQKGLDNIDDIIDATDIVMIARGDLGIEIPIEQVVHYQKEIIQKCRQRARPVIVATQMLQSMINSPIPTRAEASDVANAVFDGTDAIMLSGETATGSFPIRAVETMSDIALYNEDKAKVHGITPVDMTPTMLIVDAARNISEHTNGLKIDKIVVFTESGYTAKSLTKFRLKTPIIAASHIQKTVETLTMSYGVQGFLMDFPTGRIVEPDKMLKKLKDKNFVKLGDNVLIIHGQHWQKEGQTNALMIVKVE